ncbi:hypothetical protein A3D77_04665 [Candidatus Gottesmanbacteria bacterium RIFCSPHIGHO2_02_FULL_39_11]|uniref:Glycosyltransferase 2-like domain-containing protein n=1 Tax=Candidatus Gottesmanbacteria bacterium RIFCSPHIGHO2_02_FULL_39_11 TaxID=1798382 RepID=A0A1F5ZKH8_9BACT|nr:MAG: hypothetical protein A3D77_04665 [Candidatus Gottesmanbacteria bacterium RIFCSPHIGHO2_02_FULL_39_11]
MKLAIIILHFGNIEDSLGCIESIKKSDFPKERLKIILVNNDLNLISGSRIKSGMTQIQIINNSKNLGFAKGMNVGIKEALSDKDVSDILLLNNDTVLEKNTLSKLMDRKEEIVSPIIKFRFGNIWKYDYGGKINWLIGRPFHVELTTYNQHPTTRIDYVSGCSMRIKRKVFETIGLLDERFFFYFEDVDFCIRTKDAGFNIAVSTDTYITHKLSAGIGRWSNKAIYYNLTSNAKFIQKHLGMRRPIGFVYLFLLGIKIVWNKCGTKCGTSLKRSDLFKVGP